MSAEFTAEELREKAHGYSLRGDSWTAAVLDAYADTLSKPADSGRAAFDAWAQSLPDNYWAKYDLSACKLGWDAALAAQGQSHMVPCPVPNCDFECGICDGVGRVESMVSVAWKAGFYAAPEASPAGVPDGQVDLQSHVMRAAVARGGLRQLSRNLGIDVGYLSRLASGEKTEPGDEILAKLGLEKRVTYLSEQDAFMRACEQVAAPSAPDGVEVDRG